MSLRPDNMQVDRVFSLVTKNDAGALEKYILTNPQELHAKSFSGASLLHLACQKNLPDIAQKLLDLGADPNAHNVRGNTPLHYACLYGSLGAALILAEAGAETYPNNKVKNP